MAIFGYNSDMYTSHIDESTIVPTEECAYEINRESAEYLYKLVGGMYVSDIIIESSYGYDMNEMESVAEATLKEILKKAWEKLVEWKNKFVAWIKKVWKNILAMFMSAEKFATKYETELIEKSKNLGSDFQYFGYDYNTDAIAQFRKFNSEMTTAIRGVKLLKDKAADIENFNNDVDPIKDAIKSFTGEGDTIADAKETVTKAIRGGEEQKEVKVNTAVVKKMIGLCKNYKQMKNAIKEAEDTTNKIFNDTISDLKSQKVDDNDKVGAAVINKKISGYTAATSACTAMSTHCVSLIKEMYKVYGTQLKRVMKYKPANESYTYNTNDDSSILESALNML